MRLVAAGLIVLCAGTLVYEVRRGAFEATRDGLQYVGADRSYSRVLVRDRVEEIRRQFADRVPAGSRVRIVAPSEVGTFWYIWLSEFATFQGVRVAGSTGPADLTVAVIEGDGGPLEVRLAVERLP